MEKSTVYFENESASVYYSHSIDTVVLQYHKKVSGLAEFIEINSAVIEAFTSSDTPNFVADIRHMSIISLDAQKWVVDNLFPALLKHLNGKQLFHAQLLDPKEILSRVAASNLKKKSVQVEEGFTIEQFTDEESLISRLKEVRSIAA